MLLEIRKVVKTFPGTIALNEVDFDLEEGEVHAVVGENGAGKSTLMKIISGVHAKDSGTILINGTETPLGSVDESRALGISMIYQELENIQKLSVAENIFLGQLPRGKLPGFVDFKSLRRAASSILREFDLDIDPSAPLSHATTAEQQFIEIIKAIAIKNARIVIMDEPTSSLTNKEVDKLFAITRELKRKRISVIYISHRLDEIIEIADRVSVFRDGKNRGVLHRNEFDASTIVSLMIGHEINVTAKPLIKRDRVIFEVHKLSIRNKVHDFRLRLHEGEVLGIAGLMGSGKDELVKSIVGLWPAEEKEISFLGEPIEIRHPADSIARGIIYLPEERKLQSIFAEMSVSYNISPLWLFNVEKSVVINRRKETEMSKGYVKRLSIKTPSVNTPIVSLSGGNQQKAIFSRLLAVRPKLMILNDPTRGIDVGSKEEIYAIIQQLASEGVAILLLSSEIPEVTRLANSVIVLSKGETCAEFSDHDVTTANIIRSVTRV